MQNKQPKTIADLNIDLSFCVTEKFHTFSSFQAKFIKNNPELKNYKIIPGIYSFDAYIPVEKESTFYRGNELIWRTVRFDITLSQGTLIDLLYKIDFAIHQRILKEQSCTFEGLDRFVENINDTNSFHIDLCIPH